ncbi:tandem-95 repeat protein [Rhodopirellula halodulae]|uniref:tandem-95 repeat protein n=1 Tax=Rhodopirellula halodulae TaxID=2894198 RepID=UPI001E3D4676|nr:tandem-95 repeat protein [Rhodopirellula sp. JC737]MCC9657531.1 tandem-95 repeat protein [Rhodopirellula sp. JC737]
MTQRRNLRRRGSSSTQPRRLHHQTLERRELLAAEIVSGPRLVSVAANTGSQFDLNDNNVLSVAPSELTFRFDGGSQVDGSTLDGIRFVAAGGDGTFDSEDFNNPIQPGFLGFEGDQTGGRVVVARFAETLSDDRYRIVISGYDDTTNGVVALRNESGEAVTPAQPDDPQRPAVNIDFEIEVGPKVVAVVPQPVSLNGNTRVQARDEVHVYFNDDPLSNLNAGIVRSTDAVQLPVVNPDYYKLIFTNDTVENTDDPVYVPTLVEYDPALNRATLTFDSDLSELPDVVSGTDVLQGPQSNSGSGTFRLRIGRGDAIPAAPSEITASELPDTFSNAQSLGTTFGNASQSVLVDGGLIRSAKDVIPDWPGAYDAAGLREYRREGQLTQQVDTTTGINVYPYNFAELYGTGTQGQKLSNAITEAQKERAREVLDLYSKRMGIQFVETEDSGLQIVTGDLQAVVLTADTGAGEGTPYSLYRVNEKDPTRGVLVMDAGEPWFDGYGLSPDSRPSWFVEALRGIGNVIGIGDLFEQPDGVAAGGSSPDEPNSVGFTDFSGNAFPNLPTEPEFLSQSDITLGQALHRPESDDVDFYSFNVTEEGRITAETFAQRLDDSSLLDTLIQLYRVVPASGSNPTSYELVASNDDFFSNDSLVSVDVAAGDYVLGISSTGNDSYNGEVEGSALGGRTEGAYQLRVTFKPDSDNTITDTAGSRLDGDADDVEGGEFNFWFRTAREVSAANEPRVIYVLKDADGDDTNDGSFAAPVRTVDRAFELSEPGDIVRLLPSAGADNMISTVGDNPAYEIGRGGTGDRALDDGDVFEVPQGVTVMIDAGAILKLRTAKISVGSESVDEDRSLAALQVLGTPILVDSDGIAKDAGEVFFTSFDDPTIGIDNNPLPTVPSTGHWAGIEFRNDFDFAEGRPVWETEGIFLDYVSHANMQYGGGKIDTNAPVVTPLQMRESRPTLIYNTIMNSADAAMSADPDSFRETNFHSPRYQSVASFTSDYGRVGPEIAGNTLINNTINGLFVRVDTPAAGELQPMSVSGRFDDHDIVHAISEVLTIEGNPGGPVLLEERPDVLSVTVQTSTAGGSLADGTYDYVMTYVTKEGDESLASLATRSVASTTGAVRLSNLPSAPAEFAGRNLYRLDLSAPAGVVRYELVTQLDRRATFYVDDGTTRGGILNSEQTPDLSGIAISTFAGPVGTSELQENRAYDYRMTYVDAYGGESKASEASTMQVVARNDGIFLNNLPPTAEGFVGRNLYRSSPDTGEYILVARLMLDETSFVDQGIVDFAATSLLGEKLGNDINGGTKLLPQYDARLSIDPGIIVKSELARIEATFGADFYAEGNDGNKVIFTSRSDDTYGAGGTFDSNNNGPSVGAPGDWGGLVFRQDTTASLDFAEIRYGGGTSPIEGGFTEFNALEILQADVRVTNSTFTRNADGFANTSTREGRGFNDESVIFVRGSQPIILNNVIADNEGAAISINPDALNFDDVLDMGRSTGPSDIIATDLDNQGPLIAGNLLDLNELNGLRVRSEIITTDSVWDDTDIVHVVEGSVVSMTNHFYGGLQLKSDVGQSLVVKFGPNGTLIGSGRPLDIEDRIGGTLQVLGTPGNPVVLTSINDVTVGAGYTPDGRALLQTAANATDPAAGDWQGLQLLPYINDRNVAYVLENERAIASDITVNSTPDDAQVVGDLARDEYAGDENERLGFNIRGTLATPQDQDVFRFTATGGTELFIDIDETSFGLDTVVELINVNEDVVASSNDSFSELSDAEVSTTDQSKLYVNPNLPNGVSVDDVRPLFRTGNGFVESPNSLDAGFRVVLPGDTQRDNTYFVRVRTLNQKTEGQYELSLRLRETDETAGSTVQLADIRYATDAIAVSGAPLHSPLVGDVGEAVRYIDPTPANRNSGDERTIETENNRLGFNTGSAQTVGNLLTSDRGALVITGEIGNIDSTNLDVQIEDVDVYRVDLVAQQISPDVFDSENRFVTATFDIDYADALGRVNTSIAVYNAAGQLVLHSRDSNIADDQGRPLNGVDMENLDGGSAGVLDAYIGPVELPEGTYYVAVSGEVAVPQALDQFFNPNTSSPLTRLMPINSVRRIAEDSLFGTSATVIADRQFESRIFEYAAEAPVVEPVFDESSIVPYSFDDIRLFVSLDGAITGNNNSVLLSVNPFTGKVERLIGQSGQPTGDLAIRRDGELFSYSLGPQSGQENNGNVGNFLNISPFNGAASSAGDDGITFQRNNQAGTDLEGDDNAQLDIHAMAFQPGPAGNSINTSAVSDNERFFLVGERDNNGRFGEIPDELTRNLLYQAVASNGQITSLGSTNTNAHRNFDGTIPYRAFYGTTSPDVEHGVIDTGFIYDTGADGGDITGMAYIPNGALSNDTFLAATDLGGIHTFSPNDTIPAPTDNIELAGYNRVIQTTYYGRVVADPNHTTASFDPFTGESYPQFESLSFGPQSVEGGRLQQTIFAATSDGWLYALELDGQSIRPANVFYNGRSAIQMQFDIGSAVGDFSRTVTGIAFSNLENNPWHVSPDRRLDDGQGLYPDESQTRVRTFGGSTLYYGFEVTGNADDNTIARADGDNLGQIAPGGSQGSIVSKPFNLSEVNAADKPTLYFSYFVDVEGDDDYTPSRAQNDSFRVFGSGDDGEWKLLATNNNYRELADADEYDYFNETGVIVQELFDDGNDWRQARVDVSSLAGNENVQIRFDFSTAGSMRTHFGSINVSGTAGKNLEDGEVISFQGADSFVDFQVAFQDPELQQIFFNLDDFNSRYNFQYETILGRDVVFPSGADLEIGDELIVNGPEGPVAITFVAAPSATPKPLNEVVFNVGMSRDEVARTVVASVDSLLAPYFDGNGRVSFRAASSVLVDGNIAAGQATPVEIEANLSRMIVPTATTFEVGEQIEVTGPDNLVTTLVYTNVDNSVAPATFFPGEVFVAPTDTKADIAEKILEQLPRNTQAYVTSTGDLVFANDATTLDFVPAPTNITVAQEVANEARIEVTIPAGASIANNEQLTFVDPDGFSYTVQFVDSDAPDVVGDGFIPFSDDNAGTAGSTLARRIFEDLPARFSAVVNGNVLSIAGTSVTSNNGGTSVTTNAVTDTSLIWDIDLPTGDLLHHGEEINLFANFGFGTTVTLVREGLSVPNPGDILVYFNSTSTATEVATDIVRALNEQSNNFQAYLDQDDDGFRLAGNINFVFLTSSTTVTSFVQTDIQTYSVPITLPKGSEIVPGESFTVFRKDDPFTLNEQSYTFVTTPPASPTEIFYDVNDTAEELAQRVVSALDPELQPIIVNNREVHLLNAKSVELSNANSLVVSYESSVDPDINSPFDTRPTPILVSVDQTGDEVALQLRKAFAEGFGRIASAATGFNQIASADQYPIYGGDTLRLYDAIALDIGSYGLSQPEGLGGILGPGAIAMPGDEFGLSASSGYATSQIRTAGADDNQVEGVYIDDIIIGLAERGEMVINAPVGNTNYVFDPSFLPDSHPQAEQPERQNETLVGPYSLEIRTADEYGVPQDYDPINLELNEDFGLGRSFDSNDRLVDGAVTLIAPAGNTLIDVGTSLDSTVTESDTFVLDDGTYQLTFEFDSILDTNGVETGHVRVPFDPSSTDPAAVARAIRNAINSPQVQNVLNITAANADGAEQGASNSTRVELFGDAISVNPSGGRFIKMDLVAEETHGSNATSRRIAIVDHDEDTVEYVNFGDQTAQSSVTGFVNGDVDTFVGVGKIGDAVNVGVSDGNVVDDLTILSSNPLLDYDSVRIYLSANQSVDIDVDTLGFTKAGDTLGLPVISVLASGQDFDLNANLVRSSSFLPSTAPGETLGGAFLTFTAPTNGFYDVVISSNALFGGGPVSEIDKQFGEYQLTIRPNAAASARIPDRDVLMVDYQFGTTDVNRTDDQGQIIISSNIISDSSNYGISATLGDRGQGNTSNGVTQDTLPGSARLLRNENPTGLVPGAVIINNVVSNSGTGGILFGGGTFDDGESPAPNLFGRIVNNTVVNQGSGDGITVNGRANPTLLNNVISGFDVGIQVDTVTSGNTVVGGNAFHENNTDSTLPIASSSIVIPDGTALFQDPSRSIFIPVENSPIIDSSFASLPDRNNFFNTVKNPVGIAASPIIAPSFDAYGQPRVDGQSNSSGGVGANVFIDRGALDRADDGRPVALLINPFDADGVEAASQNVNSGDTDPGSSFVRLTNPTQTVEFFEIQLVDPSGTGPDPETITVDSVLLTENGRRLLPDQDFTFGYSANSRTIRLTPLAGLWRQDAVYEITLNNQPRISFDAVSGDQIADGDQVTVVDSAGRETVFEFESGTSITVPQTSMLRILDVTTGFQDRDVFTITAPDGSSQSFEINLTGSTAAGNVAIELAGAGNIADIRDRILAAINSVQAGLDLAPRAIGFDSIQLGVLSGHTVTLGTGFSGMELVGTNAGVESGQSFTYTSNGTTVEFVFDDSNSFVETDTMRQVPISRTDTPDEIAQSIVNAVGGVALGLDAAQATGEGSVLLGGLTSDVLDITNSQLSRDGAPGVTASLSLTVPNGRTGSDVDGTTFSLDVGGVATTFRFTTDASMTSADRLILITAGDDAATLAGKIAAVIGAVYPDELSPNVDGTSIQLNEASAMVALGETRTVTTITTGTSGLTQSGISGGAVPVDFLPSANFSEASVAATLQRTILNANLGLEIFAPGGGTLLIDGANSVSAQFTGDGVVNANGLSIPAVSDIAGNPVRETRINDETRFTIIMPEVRFDFGDAPASYGTLLESPLNSSIPGNGARHAVVNDGSSIQLGASIDTEADGTPSNSATNDVIGDDVTIPISASTASAAVSITLGTDIIDIEITAMPTVRDTIELVVGTETFTFELLDAATNPSPGNIPVLFNTNNTLREIEIALLTAIRPQLDFTGGGVDALTHPTNAEGIRVRAIDDEDGVSIVRFDDGLNFYRVFGEPGAGGQVLTSLNADQVLGFLNPFDEAGTDIAVDVVGGGLLNGWIDFDRSGTFDEDEHVLSNVPVTTGTNIVNVTTPLSVGTLPFDTWARFRVNDAGNLGPDGVAIGGEVEDYLVSVLPIPLPEPEPRSYTAFEDATLSVDASQGLISPANRAGQLLPVRYFVVDEPSNGTLVVDTDADDDLNGSFRYIPNPDFYGVDTFTYRLSTQQNLGNIDCDVDPGDPPVCGTVTINVVPENDAPGATDQSFVMVEATATNGGDPLTIPASDLIRGAVADADAQFNPGSDTDVQDENNQTIFVHSITAGGVTINKDNRFAVAPTPEGGTLTALFNPTNEWITEITYTPAEDFNSDNGTVAGGLSVDAFTFTLIDNGISQLPADLETNLNNSLTQPERDVLGIGNGVRDQFDAISPISQPAVARIRVTPQNDAPVLAEDYVGLTDANGDPNTDYTSFFGGAVPTPTEDTLLVFPTAYLTRNDMAGPVGADDENNGANGNDAPVMVTSVSLVDPTQGTLTLDTNTNEISFLPAPNVYGEIEFTYTAIDSGVNEDTSVGDVSDDTDRGNRTPAGIAITQSATIFVEPVNDAPVAYDRFASTVEDTALTLSDVQILSGVNVTPSAIVATTAGVTMADADQLREGETLILTAANGRRVVIEFNSTGTPSIGTDRVVQFTDGETADVLASRLELTLRSVGFGGTLNGDSVTFEDAGQLAFVAGQNAVVVDSAAGRVTVPEGRLIQDGEVVTLTDSTGTPSRFVFTKTGSVLINNGIAVSISDSDTAEEVANALSDAMLQAGFGAVETAGTQQEFRIRMDNVAQLSVNRAGTGLVPDGSDVIIPAGSGIQSGDALIVELTDGTTVVAEFRTGTTLSDPNAVLVQYTASDSRAQISAALEAALTSRGVTATPVTLTSWQVDLVDITSVDVTGTAITFNGTDIVLPVIGDLVSGQSFSLTDENNVVRRIELNTTGNLSAGNDAVVQYDPAGSIDDVATDLAAVLRSLDIGAFANGNMVTLRTSDTLSRSLSPTSITLNGTNILVPAGDRLIDGERFTISDVAGVVHVVEFSLSGQPSAGADVIVPFTVGDSADTVATTLQEQLRAQGVAALADTGALGTPSGQSLVSLQLISAIRMGELADASGMFDNRLGAPFNENEQSLRIISFSTPNGNAININSVPAGATTATIDSDAGGAYTFTVETVQVNGQDRRYFSGVTFDPAENYNSELPFASRELLLYTIEDDAFTRIDSPAQTRQDVGDIRQSIAAGTITITVDPVNDPPVFNNDLNTVDVLERDDLSTTTVPGFLTEIFSATSTASDELLAQIVTGFEVRLVADPNGVLNGLPVVNYVGGETEASLTVAPNPDKVGQATFELYPVESGIAPSQIPATTFTVNVRPVNDAPRIRDGLTGDSVPNDPDEAYAISGITDTDGDGFNDQAVIQYTLREDNTQPTGSSDPANAVTTGNYFIPLSRAIPEALVQVGSYQRIGLLDIYTVGADNEAQSLNVGFPIGGPQQLELFDFPDRTALGGTLTPRFEGNQLIGLNYTPPVDFNNTVDPSNPFDSFEFEVRDDFPGDGETYSTDTGTLIQDRRRSTSIVQLNLNPVNDRPQFVANTLQYEVAEDGAPQRINNFAVGIAAGPPLSAFDEVDFINGQEVQFTVKTLSFLDDELQDFFIQGPEISNTGVLTFQPQADVFGTFEFEVVLTEILPGSNEQENSTRGDLRSSLPVTLTIDVQPVNDRPTIKDEFSTAGSNPLNFSLSEDGTFDVLVTGDGTSPGLLDVFDVGPDNEAADNTPGGNQSLSLTTPTPVTTAEGGTLTPIRENGEITRFQYTPRANFVGTDSFIYTVTDDGVTVPVGNNGVPIDEPRIASGTVTFEVFAVNDAPQFSGAGDVTSDEDQNDGGGNGSVVIENWATNVQAGPPGANDEIGDGNGQPLRFEIIQTSNNPELFVSPPTASIDADGNATLMYTTAENLNGSATFTVQLFDEGPNDSGNGDINASTIRTFTITVDPVNDAPTFTAGPTVQVQEDRGPFTTQWATNISPGPIDESTQSVTFEVTTVNPEDADLFTETGQPQISPNGILSFTPASNANGQVDLQVVARDSEGLAGAPVTLRINIQPVNDFPAPAPDFFSTNEDTIRVISAAELLANDADVDLNDANPDELQIVMNSPQFSLRGALVTYDPVTQTITYDPTVSAELQALTPNSAPLNDSFAYAVADRAGAAATPIRTSNSVLVSASVSGVNDGPVTEPDVPTLQSPGSTVIRVLDNDVDVDGSINPASLTVTKQPAFGSVTIDPNAGTITYTPFTNFPGNDEFRYIVADDQGTFSAEETVTISPNAAPAGTDTVRTGFLNESIIINIANNFEDADGLDFSSVQIERQPLAGEIQNVGDGTLRYIPATGYTGRDTFDYSIADQEGRRSGLATVTLQVVTSRLQNPDLNTDVNDDGQVSALDALLIINHLNRFSSFPADYTPTVSEDLVVTQGDNGRPDASQPGRYYDVSGDLRISSLDALQVINELNRRDASGNGEPAGESIVATSAASTVTAQTGLSTSTGSDPAAGEPLFEILSENEKLVSGANSNLGDDVLNSIATANSDGEGSESSGEDRGKDLQSAVDAAMAKLL